MRPISKPPFELVVSFSEQFHRSPPKGNQVDDGSCYESQSTQVSKFDYKELLPAVHRTRDDELEAPDAGDVQFLARELLVDRLNEIHGWLFLVGRPMPPRPLHQQRVMLREIVVTEQADLHMAWSGGRMFIKPLPRYLLDYQFWCQNLLCKPDCLCSQDSDQHERKNGQTQVFTCCPHQELYRCATGLLLSYASLVSYESDFHIAKHLHLLPSSLSWSTWVRFVRQLLEPRNKLNINKRYEYGELRLSRLNEIYRFRKGFLIQGYLYNYKYDKYMSFLGHNLARIFAVGAYMVIILNAMQVGLATNRLEQNLVFQRACYGFVILAILGPMILLAVAMAAFFIIMFYNCLVTRAYHKRREKGRHKQRREAIYAAGMTPKASFAAQTSQVSAAKG